MPSLSKAMDKLEAAIEKPTSPFHVSFKKTQNDGFAYQCEADISQNGIIGQQTNVNPATRVGDTVFPAGTRVRQINGTPFGTLDWSTARGGIVMGYMSGNIGDGQAGIKYIADDSINGYSARRYDFDLANVSSAAKSAMTSGVALIQGSRQVKDYNVKGSAWIAKDDGRMVKFQYDFIMRFADGNDTIVHYDGVVSPK